MESRTVTAELPSHKRPRSPSGDYSPTVSKMPKTQSNSLHINYLARQYPDNLPLVSTDDSLPNILRLIGEYDGVLQRHESIAGNLGACPLGPILMKRFERLFEGPPRVLKSNGKEGTNVTWLDVVEFAKSKPEQFNLEKTRNGVRVCQFYTKQCRVEISEEDYVLIASGMPQKLIPPQPIDEDEEKEVGVLEILEKNLQQITAMADSAAARARQLSYRLKSRRNAIVTRRENDRNKYSQSPPLHEHGTDTAANGTGFANPPSPPGGFVAVNTNRPAEAGDEHPSLSSQFMLNHPNTDNITIINGTNIKGASPTTRAELLKKFLTTADRAGRSGQPEAEGSSSLTRQSSRTGPRRSEASEMPPVLFNNSTGTVAIPNTPPSLLPQPKSVNHHERDDGGPFKLEMVARMEDLQRGERILPPCDRCRRLHMDCLKNLTACMGCTKKHAKCSWKDVKEEELRDLQPRQPRAHVDEQRDFARPAAPDGNNHQDEHGADHSHPHHSVYPHDTHVEPHPNPHNALVLAQSEPPSHPYSQHQTPREHATAPRRANSDVHIMLNHDQHPDTHHQHHHHPQHQQHQPHQPPTQHQHQPQHDRRSSFHHRNILHDNNSINNSNSHHRSNHHRNETDNDPDANSRLMQAIKDTVDHHSTRVQKHIRDGE